MNFFTLHEGGAVGHLSHVWEDTSLTFGELKKLLRAASLGKLENVSEKIDGLNCVFTYNVKAGGLAAARNGGDIKNGGMDAVALAKKFAGRGNLEKAFNDAFSVLSDAMEGLSEDKKLEVFGQNADRWYSVEVVYTANPNVVVYDTNSIVFHGWPVFEKQPDGSVKKTDDTSGVETLASSVQQMQSRVKSKDWTIHGPAMVKLKKLADGSAYKNAVSSLETAMHLGGVGDGNTLQDYVQNMFADDVDKLGLPDDVSDDIVARCAGLPNAPSLTDIKKKITDKAQKERASAFVAGSPVRFKAYVKPVENAVQSLAFQVLDGLQSSLVADSGKEVQRIKSQVTRAMAAIKSSGNPQAMDVLDREMSRLGSVDNIGSPMEGIVFLWNGKTYKFTGSFASVNQLLSLFKYDKKDMPRMNMGENLLREAVKMFVNEASGDSGAYTPWSAAAKKKPFEPPKGLSGVGPGEERLAIELHGKVMGGGVAYDIVDSKGRKWEVKKPVGGEIRPGTEGMAEVAIAHDRIKKATSKIESVFGSKTRSKTAAAAEQVMGSETMGKIRDFVTNEASMIMKGEVSKGRMDKFYEVISLIHAAFGTAPEEQPKKHVELGDAEHTISRDVDLATYVKLGKVMDLDAKDLNVSARDMLASTFNTLAFTNPDKFMEVAWKKAALASNVFSKTEGVILVNENGYRIVPRSKLDNVIVFNRITKGFPHFKVVG